MVWLGRRRGREKSGKHWAAGVDPLCGRCGSTECGSTGRPIWIRWEGLMEGLMEGLRQVCFEVGVGVGCGTGYPVEGQPRLPTRLCPPVRRSGCGSGVGVTARAVAEGSTWRRRFLLRLLSRLLSRAFLSRHTRLPPKLATHCWRRYGEDVALQITPPYLQHLPPRSLRQPLPDTAPDPGTLGGGRGQWVCRVLGRCLAWSGVVAGEDEHSLL